MKAPALKCVSFPLSFPLDVRVLSAVRREDRARKSAVEARQAFAVRGSRCRSWRDFAGSLIVLTEQVLPSRWVRRWVRRNQWAAVRRYTEDGRLTIDNNVAERRLRDQAVAHRQEELAVPLERGGGSASGDAEHDHGGCEGHGSAEPARRGQGRGR